MAKGFNGDVELITVKGKKKFKDLINGQVVIVKGVDNTWVQGVVKKTEGVKCVKCHIEYELQNTESTTYIHERDIVFDKEQPFKIAGELKPAENGDKFDFDNLEEMNFDNKRLAKLYCFGRLIKEKDHLQQGKFGLNDVDGNAIDILRSDAETIQMFEAAGYMKLHIPSEEYETYVQTEKELVCDEDKLSELPANEKQYLFFGYVQSLKQRITEPHLGDDIVFAVSCKEADQYEILADVSGYYVIKRKEKPKGEGKITILSSVDARNKTKKWLVADVSDVSEETVYTIACDKPTEYIIQGGIITLSEVNDGN